MRTRKRTFQFMHAFLTEPAATGAIVPSSRFLADRMLRGIDWNRVRVIVELGSGVGCFTERILARMPGTATLIAIDSNRQFTRVLRRSFQDSRLRVVHGSALQVKHELRCAGFSEADCIVCGLPFANMPSAVRLAILQTCRDVLRPQGTLVLFQYRRLLLPVLNGIFASVSRDYELLNFPPAHVFHCTTGAIRQRQISSEPKEVRAVSATEQWQLAEK